MHSLFFSLAIAALTILALVGCTDNIKVIKSLQVLTLDLTSITKESVFPEISSELTSIPDYIKIGLMGYCTPETCVRRNFAQFSIEDILVDAVLGQNNLTSLATSAIDVVLPTEYSNYMSKINKIVDVFSILLAAWFSLAGVVFIVTCLSLLLWNNWLFFIVVSLCKSICFALGCACSALATAGLIFARNEFNKNEADDLGISLALGSAFLGLLWGAVLCSVLDAFTSFLRKIFFRRREKTQQEFIPNRWGYKV